MLVKFLFELHELLTLVFAEVCAHLVLGKTVVFTDILLVTLDCSDHHHDFVLSLLLVCLDGDVIVYAEVVSLLLLEHFIF